MASFSVHNLRGLMFRWIRSGPDSQEIPQWLLILFSSAPRARSGESHRPYRPIRRWGAMNANGDATRVTVTLRVKTWLGVAFADVKICGVRRIFHPRWVWRLWRLQPFLVALRGRGTNQCLPWEF